MDGRRSRHKQKNVQEPPVHSLGLGMFFSGWSAIQKEDPWHTGGNVILDPSIFLTLARTFHSRRPHCRKETLFSIGIEEGA